MRGLGGNLKWGKGYPTLFFEEHLDEYSSKVLCSSAQVIFENKMKM